MNTACLLVPSVPQTLDELVFRLYVSIPPYMYRVSFLTIAGGFSIPLNLATQRTAATYIGGSSESTYPPRGQSPARKHRPAALRRRAAAAGSEPSRPTQKRPKAHKQ